MSVSVVRVICLLFVLGLFGACLINLRYIFGLVKNLLSDFKAPLLAWILVFVGIFLVTERTPENVGSLANVVFQVSMVGAATIIVACTYFARLQGTMARVNLGLLCLAGYALVGVVSGIYSPDALLSVYKSCLVLLDALLCAVLLSYKPVIYYVRKFIHLTYIFFMLLVVSILVGVVIWPDAALEPRPSALGFLLQGAVPIINSNEVTFISAIAGVVTFNRLFGPMKRSWNRRLLPLAMLACSLIVMFLSQSRTSIFAFALAVLLILLVRRKVAMVVGCVLLVIVGVAVSKGSVERAEEYIQRGQTTETFSTLSGRTRLWQAALDKIAESPALGYGMSSSRSRTVITKYEAGHMHNAYLEVLLNTGIIGFAFWLSALIWATIIIVRVAWRNRKKPLDHNRILQLDMAALLTLAHPKLWTGESFVVHNYSFFLFMCFIAYSSIATSAAFSQSIEPAQTEVSGTGRKRALSTR